MHIPIKTQHVRLLRGKLCREVFARVAGETPYAVFREMENGDRLSRNIQLFQIAGWLYATPEEIGREEWSRWAPKSAFCYDCLSADDLALIEETKPAFRWCLRKADERSYTGAEIFKLLRFFENDPRVEFLVGAGLKNLALSAGFRKIGKHLREDVVRWSIKNGDYGLKAALGCLRERIEIGEWIRWQNTGDYKKLPYNVWKHVDRQGVYPWEYFEYLRTLEEIGKDAKDPYWGMPTSFRRRRRQAERIAANLRKAKDAADREARRVALEKVASAYSAGTFGGLRVWVPCTMEDFEKQAKALDQCLISMDYASRVANDSCVLVFIADDAGHPLATAELLPKGKGWRVGQFYGDERKDDYLAKEPEREALKLWAKQNRLRLNMGRAA